jgi:hypothetical protein
MVYMGTRVQIGSRVSDVHEDKESVVYTLRDNEIALDLIPRQGQARVVLK